MSCQPRSNLVFCSDLASSLVLENENSSASRIVNRHTLRDVFKNKLFFWEKKMNGFLHEKQRRIRTVLFFAAAFAIAWYLTSLTPLIADDFNYAFTWADEGIGRIDNFYLVYTSMQSHRMWTHGRVFAQGWVSLFMMWPKWVFNLANGAVAVMLLAAVYHFFLRSRVERPLSAVAAVAAVYWICMPAFGQVFLWLDGACNYSWGAALGFLLIELTLSVRKMQCRTICTILLLPLSFVVGAWSEHISFAVLVILFLFWLSEWIQGKRLPVRESLVLLAGCGGYLFLMLAPSMLPSILKYRAKEAAGGHVQGILSVSERFWWLIPFALAVIMVMIFLLRRIRGRRKRLTVLTGLICRAVLVAALICGLLDFLKDGFCGFISSTPFGFLLLLACFLGGLERALKDRVDTEIIRDAVFLAVGGISALSLFAFAMYIPARGFCAPVIFVGAAAVLLWSSLKHETWQRHWTVVSFAVCFAVFFVTGLVDILSLHHQALKREEAIRQSLLSDGILVTEPYRVMTKYSAQYGLLDLMPGESWPNDYIKEYYQLRDIVVLTTETES